MSFKSWMEINSGLERHFKKMHPHLPNYVANQTLHNRVAPLFKRSQLSKANTAQFGNSNSDFMGDEEIPDYETLPSLYGHKKIANIANTKQWKLQTIDLHPTQFTPHTIEAFFKHQFGRSPALSQKVRDHNYRLNTQQQLAQQRGEDNEPIIIRKVGDLYSMEEGWHRLYGYIYNAAPPEEKIKIEKGQQDVDLKKWNNIRIKAYIGS